MEFSELVQFLINVLPDACTLFILYNCKTKVNIMKCFLMSHISSVWFTISNLAGVTTFFKFF